MEVMQNLLQLRSSSAAEATATLSLAIIPNMEHLEAHDVHFVKRFVGLGNVHWIVRSNYLRS